MVYEQRPIRIAGCSGSATDRRDALTILVENHPNDPLDVIIGDWMSEANMTARAASKLDDPDAPAYEPTFIEALEPALSTLAKYKIKLAVNAGASDTEKLCGVVSKMAEERGLKLNVAWISGDEVLPEVKKAMEGKSSEFENVYTGEKLADWSFEPIYAQAYLGGLGIAAAFSAGADIVICGRVSDASPTIGAAVWWHSWQRDNLECLANALIAGHLIECSSYVCGGNFTGFKQFQKAGGAWDLPYSYPIAEIGSKGQVVITKNAGSGGAVSVDTCTSQLLYEIQGPWYFNSDVTADLTTISFSHLATNRVALRGIKALPPPPTTKVGITAKGGYQAEFHWYIVGLDCKAKASMMEASIRALLAPYIENFSVLDFQLIGSVPEDPKDQNSATVDLRVFVQAREADDLAPAKFARPCLDPVMAGYPGATFHFDMRQAFPRPIYEYYVSLLPQSAISHVVHCPWAAASEQDRTIPPPPMTRTYPARQPTTRTPLASRLTPGAKGGTTDAAGGWAELPAAVGRSVLREVFGPWGRTIRGPLGALVHARSGDKGSDCNVGFWPARRGQAEYEWLASLLTVSKLRDLLGRDYKGTGREDPARYIERFEFNELRAVHFLLRGHLDRGVSCTRSLDFLGKNTAEFLRARVVDLPVRFLEKGRL